MIEYALKELDVFNSITFKEQVHKYLINGEKSADISVTGLIGKYKPKFDEDKWARIKAKKLNISVDEMKFIWSEKNLFSTTLGTAFHKIVEGVYTGQPYEIDKDYMIHAVGEIAYKEIKSVLLEILHHFKNFYTDTKDSIIPVKNELIVGDIHNTRICGTLDMLVYDKRENCLDIYDFKTNKNITFNSTYNEKFYAPLEALDMCEYNTYNLQLSIYKYIIEKYTTLKIRNMKLVWFNRDNSNYRIIDCKDYTGYVPLMLVN